MMPSDREPKQTLPFSDSDSCRPATDVLPSTRGAQGSPQRGLSYDKNRKDRVVLGAAEGVWIQMSDLSEGSLWEVVTVNTFSHSPGKHPQTTHRLSVH